MDSVAEVLDFAFMSDTAKNIPLALAPPSPPDGIGRRAVVQALLGSMGAGLALPSVAEAQHPIVHHLESTTLVEQAQANATTVEYQAVFLDAHQLRTLEALAETIVPGSMAAKVAPFLDQLLAVDSPENQRHFLGALGAFDMAATQRHGKPWTGITKEQQLAVLTEASTGDPTKSPLRGHFQNLKTWIAGAYYSSEPGMRELGWTGSVVHPELHGCTHPGGHAV